MDRRTHAAGHGRGRGRAGAALHRVVGGVRGAGPERPRPVRPAPAGRRATASSCRPGFTSRVVARSGQVVAGTSYTWHNAPDGGAVLRRRHRLDLRVQLRDQRRSGGGASRDPVQLHRRRHRRVPDPVRHQQQLRRRRDPVEHLAVLRGGQPRPGLRDLPAAAAPPCARPAMGRFKHEAAAADPVRQVIYLTEDETDGCFYRFIPTTWGDLSSGTLQVLVRRHRHLRLVHLGERARPGRLADRDPQPGLRRQARSTAARAATTPTTPCWFTTKGDNRVWQLNLADQHLRARLRRHPGQPRPGAADRRGQHHRLHLRRPVRRRGRRQHGDLHHHAGRQSSRRSCGSPARARSEITGPAFTPAGNRLYFSSQRGTSGLVVRRHHLRRHRPVPHLPSRRSASSIGSLKSRASRHVSRSMTMIRTASVIPLAPADHVPIKHREATFPVSRR